MTDAHEAPVPCTQCRELPRILRPMPGRWCVRCDDLVCWGTTRAEAIEKWNRMNKA